MPSEPRADRPHLGWREWVALPDWNVEFVKAKVDTGARTSSLHAPDLEWFHRAGAPWVRFEVQPWQRTVHDARTVEAPVVSTRDIRSSSGELEHRPVVRTTVIVAGESLDAEVTLTRRDQMGFRMLLGRQVIRERFVVDPAGSYLGGRPPREIRLANRGRTS